MKAKSISLHRLILLADPEHVVQCGFRNCNNLKHTCSVSLLLKQWIRIY